MTEIGNSIIREYLSEVNEHIEDDKNRLRISQGLSLAHSIWLLLKFALNLFFLGFLVVVVVFLLTLDAATLDALRSASNEEILSGITGLSRFVQIIMFFGVFMVPVFGIHKFYRNRRQERLEVEQERLELLKTIVQVNEEVLYRHGLIKAEVQEDE